MEPLAHEIQKFKDEVLNSQNHMMMILQSLQSSQESLIRLASKSIDEACAQVQKQPDFLEAVTTCPEENGQKQADTTFPDQNDQNEANHFEGARDISDRGAQQIQRRDTAHLKHQDDRFFNEERATFAELNEKWDLFKGSGLADTHNWMSSILYENANKRTAMTKLLSSIFGGERLAKEAPTDTSARIATSQAFQSMSMCIILTNTGLMAYEANFQIEDGLKGEREGLPEWLVLINKVFNIVFAVELVFRMFALRTWFFTSPDWGWNLLDVFVVSISVVLEFMTSFDISFLRTLRIMRAFRVFRMLRVLRFFQELRKMLLSVLACMEALAWCGVFFTFIIFMFSLLFLQGLTSGLSRLPENSDELSVAQEEVEEYFSDLYHAMVSLFAAATGGVDWLDVRAPLEHAGPIYTMMFLFYIVFVTVGVLNVLTGIFMSSADEITDVNLAVHNERQRVNGWVGAMLEIFHDMDTTHIGRLDWAAFDQCMHNQTLQAYLSCHGLQSSHTRLLFELLADPVSKTLGVDEFVLGVLKLKGEAKALDARVLRRMLGISRPLLTNTIEKQTAIIRASLAQLEQHGKSNYTEEQIAIARASLAQMEQRSKSNDMNSISAHSEERDHDFARLCL